MVKGGIMYRLSKWAALCIKNFQENLVYVIHKKNKHRVARTGSVKKMLFLILSNHKSRWKNFKSIIKSYETLCEDYIKSYDQKQLISHHPQQHTSDIYKTFSHWLTP